MNKAVFICHAREDKPAVVHPLVFAMEKEGISCWLNEAEIAWGESVTAKVNDGLKKSDYVIVILSRAFLSKNWPKRELWAVLNIEARTGDVKVLPILVGSDTDIQYFLSEFPLLNDKRYLIWDGAPQPIVRSFLDLVQGCSRPTPDRDELLICGQCRTPFELGVQVCLGCKGTIVYGLAPHERLQKRQLGMLGTGVLLLFLFLAVPGVFRNVSEMWGVLTILSNLLSPSVSGINRAPTPLIVELVRLALLGGIGVTVSILAGFAFEWYAAKKGRNLVRTFR